MKPFKHKLSNGKKITIEERDIYGLCEDDGKVVDITVSPRIKGKLQMDTYIHELLHAEFPEWSENEVYIRATSIANMLWKAGYRRTKV